MPQLLTCFSSKYLSPERARGLPHDTRKSDMWSLGVTFFEILIGRTPFEVVDGEEFCTEEDMEKYWARTVRHSLLSWMFALSGADCLSFTAERQMDWGLEHEQGHGENAAPHDRAQCRPTMHGRGWHGRLLLERPRGVYHCFAQFVFLFTLLSIDCLLIICP